MDEPQHDESGREHLLSLTAQIVAAHVSHNSVQPDQLPKLIMDVYKTLSGATNVEAPTERPEPAVPIKRSVFPDHIICLEDGESLKMLKRHLMTAHNMTPEQYRQRWGLGPEYPMVAPEYAEQRSSLAKTIGLGRKPAEARGKAPGKRGGRPRGSRGAMANE
jgi:predicted transcriptional regulator